MKHYFNPMSRALTTDWMLREVGAEHEQVHVDFANGGAATDEYRAINPMGKVPALVDGDVVVTEVAAICAHLADRFPDAGLAPPVGSPQRGAYFRYLFVPGTTLEPMFTLHQHEVTGIPPQQAGWGDRERCMATIEVMTPAEGWALGDQFTAADVVFGGTLNFASVFGWVPDPTPKVAAYIQRIRSRPHYRAAHPENWH